MKCLTNRITFKFNREAREDYWCDTTNAGAKWRAMVKFVILTRCRIYNSNTSGCRILVRLVNAGKYIDGQNIKGEYKCD